MGHLGSKSRSCECIVIAVAADARILRKGFVEAVHASKPLCFCLDTCCDCEFDAMLHDDGRRAFTKRDNYEIHLLGLFWRLARICKTLARAQIG
jgi:hypothetical protein